MYKPVTDLSTSKPLRTSMLSAITIHSSSNKPVFEITAEGEVIFRKPYEADDAADIFCKQLQIGIEYKAGIRQTRKEWEEAHKNSIRKALKAGSLTPEKLEEIFKKHDFYGRLKGSCE